MLDRLPAYPLLTACYVLLIGFMLVEPVFTSQATLDAGLYGLLRALPLLAFSPWLWRRGSGSTLGLGLLLLPYFCAGVLSAFLPGLAGALAVVRCTLMALLFSGCLLVIRANARAVPASTPAP